jgi:hypothetical protein
MVLNALAVTVMDTCAAGLGFSAAADTIADARLNTKAVVITDP